MANYRVKSTAWKQIPLLGRTAEFSGLTAEGNRLLAEKQRNSCRPATGRLLPHQLLLCLLGKVVQLEADPVRGKGRIFGA